MGTRPHGFRTEPTRVHPVGSKFPSMCHTLAAGYDQAESLHGGDESRGCRDESGDGDGVVTHGSSLLVRIDHFFCLPAPREMKRSGKRAATVVEYRSSRGNAVKAIALGRCPRMIASAEGRNHLEGFFTVPASVPAPIPARPGRRRQGGPRLVAGGRGGSSRPPWMPGRRCHCPAPRRPPLGPRPSRLCRGRSRSARRRTRRSPMR